MCVYAAGRREIADLFTDSVASCASCSHIVEGQNSTSTDIYFANFGYFSNYLLAISGLLTHQNEPTRVWKNYK